MITVVSVIETTPRETIAFDKTYKEFSDVKLSVEVDKKFTLLAEDISIPELYSIDLSNFMQEQSEINGFSTWVELEAFFTPGLMNIYKTDAIVPNNLFTRTVSGKVLIIPASNATKLMGGPDIISVTHNLNLTMDYGTRLNPTLRNNQNIKAHLPEIIFKHNDINNPVVDFENVIPVINGVIHMPLPFEDELYVLDGTKVLSSVKPGGMANILIDFAPMGGIQIVKFSDTTKLTSNSGTILTLPAGLDMSDKSYILVIAGRMFFPNESKLLNSNTLFFDSNRFNLDNIRLSNKHLRRQFISGTNTVTLGSENYIDSIFDVDHNESFIIVINKDKVSYDIKTPFMHITERLIKFPINSGGLLMRNMTREIVDYSRQFDTDGTIVHTSVPNYVNRLIIGAPTDSYNISYANSNQNSFTTAINSEDNGYTLIDIISGN